MRINRIAPHILFAATCLVMGCSQSGDSRPKPGHDAELEAPNETAASAESAGEVNAVHGSQKPDISFQLPEDAREGRHVDPSMPEVVAKPAGKPGVTRELINTVARGPGKMFAVYDLMFDYDMARIADEDYQYLVESIVQAEAIQDAANRQSQYQNAYDAATSGDATFSFSFDPEAMFSTPQARLDTLKRIIDDARSKQSQ